MNKEESENANQFHFFRDNFALGHYCSNLVPPRAKSVRELSAYQLFDKLHVIEVTIEKTIDISQKQKPCYDAFEKHESFGEHDYKLLMNKIMKKFQCTTLYIPAEFINGSKICQNSTTTNLVHEFMKYSSPTFATNLWTSDYYSPPPCVYHKYSVDQTIAGKGK